MYTYQKYLKLLWHLYFAHVCLYFCPEKKTNCYQIYLINSIPSIDLSVVYVLFTKNYCNGMQIYSISIMPLY